MYGEKGPVFSVTRYGNVVWSAGSLFPRWDNLLARRATALPVTHPDCTRFFMRMDEAVHLVWETLQSPAPRLAIPRNLPAFRVGDLAEALEVPMEILGLPPWEKLHEGLEDGLTSDKARRMTRQELLDAFYGGSHA